MPKAIRIHQQGGPEVMKWEDVQVGDPGPGEARVRHKACGLNFLDVYQRSGLYKIALPSGMGNEGAGVVEAVGAGRHARQGRRPRRLFRRRARRVFRGARHARRPPGRRSRSRFPSKPRAAMMLKGLTAQYLLKQTYKVRAGETVLWHAAAGGVGLIACQWLKALGVTVHRHGGIGGEMRAR